MEKYGYMYDKLATEAEQFIPRPSLKTEESQGWMIGIGGIAFILLFWILFKT